MRAIPNDPDGDLLVPRDLEEFAEFVRLAWGVAFSPARDLALVVPGERRAGREDGGQIVATWATPWIWSDPESTLCAVYVVWRDGDDESEEDALELTRTDVRVRLARLRSIATS